MGYFMEITKIIIRVIKTQIKIINMILENEKSLLPGESITEVEIANGW